MLHLRPDLVRSKDFAPGFTGDMETVMVELRKSGLGAVTEEGVLGDPTSAETGRGARYLDVLADDLAALIGNEDAR
jgi:creatinine amidohydrolase